MLNLECGILELRLTRWSVRAFEAFSYGNGELGAEDGDAWLYANLQRRVIFRFRTVSLANGAPIKAYLPSRSPIRTHAEQPDILSLRLVTLFSASLLLRQEGQTDDMRL